MKRSIPLSLALTLLFTGLSMSVVFADELEADEAVISETEIDDTDVSTSEDSIEIIPSEVSDDDLPGDTEDLIDADNMAMQPTEGNGTAGETVTDGVFNGVVNADGTVTVTGLVNPSEDLEVLSIPSEIEGKKVTIIDDGAFYEYKNSHALLIPDTITKIGDLAFYRCNFINGIVLGKNVKEIGDKAFYCCHLGKFIGDTLEIPDSVEIIGDSAFQDLDNEHSKLKLGQNVKKIGDNAFSSNHFTGDLIIPDSVTTIGDNAFYCCAFGGKVKLGNHIKSIGNNTFDGCGFIGNLTIPDSVSYIGDSAFYECISNGKIKLGKNIKTIGDKAFYHCRFTGNLVIPNKVTTIGKNAFSAYYYDRTYAGTLKIGKKVKIIDDSAFMYCEFKGDLIIPNSVTTIGERAFYESGFSGNLKIGKKVEVIEENAFFRCNFEKTLTLPKSLKSVDFSAFYCQRIRKIVNHSNCTLKAFNFMDDGSECFVDNKGQKIPFWGTIKKGTYVKQPVKVSGVTLDPKTAKIFKGEQITLSATVSPTSAFNRKVTWKSSNPKIASVSKKGVVKGRKPGTATITVTTVDGKKTAKCRVTVKNLIKVKSVKLDKVAFVNKGDYIALVPSIKPENANNQKVRWESSDPGIAKVDKNGNVKGIEPGIAYITVTTVDGNKQAKCKVTVRQ